MATLQAAINRIQDLALTMTGIRSAPDYVPSGKPPLPAVITYPASGTFTRQADWKQGLADIRSDIIVERTDTARAMTTLTPFVETFANTLWNDITLGSVVAAVTAVRWETFEADYGGVPIIGLRFTITVKQNTAVS